MVLGKMMMFFAAVALAGFMAQVQAQAGYCGIVVEMEAALEREYGAVLRSSGVESPISVVRVYASGEGGMFTVIRVFATGVACVIAGGPEGWHEEPMVKEGEPT